MKSSKYVILLTIVFAIIACNQNLNNNYDLVGIWQNKTDPNTIIEFTDNGEYFLRVKGKKLGTESPLDDPENQFNYLYDSNKNDVNLKIFPKLNGPISKANLTFSSSNQIKIVFFHKNTVFSETVYIRQVE